MHLDARLVNFKLVDQETQDLLTLVALDLNDATVLLVVNDIAVAIELLLESLQNLLDIEGSGKAGERSDTLTAIALLVTDVNVIGAVVDSATGSSEAYFWKR